MGELAKIDTPAERQKLTEVPGLPHFDATVLDRHSPDAHWVMRERDGNISGHFSLWWKNTAPHASHRLGYVGHYAARDRQAAVSLLATAARELGARGCSLAVGPIDGSTWRRYRLITERGDEPVFFLESDQPEDWPSHFVAAGFSPFATYCSELVTDLDAADPRMDRVTSRMAQLGVRIRSVNLAAMDDELRRIHSVALTSFRDNFLYTPINEAEFLSLYRPVVPCVNPDFVLLAETAAGAPVGFIFALPDLNEKQRTGACGTLIVKTMAVRPGRQFAGLGKLLLTRVYESARRQGFRRAILAYMHDSNPSTNLGGGRSRVIRRYTLYARRP